MTNTTFGAAAFLVLAASSSACNIDDNTSSNATATIPNATLTLATDADVDNVMPSHTLPMMATVHNVFLVEPSAAPPPEHVADAGYLEFHMDDESTPPLIVTAQTSVDVPIPADAAVGLHKIISRVHRYDDTPTTVMFEVDITIKDSRAEEGGRDAGNNETASVQAGVAVPSQETCPRGYGPAINLKAGLSVGGCGGCTTCTPGIKPCTATFGVFSDSHCSHMNQTVTVPYNKNSCVQTEFPIPNADASLMLLATSIDSTDPDSVCNPGTPVDNLTASWAFSTTFCPIDETNAVKCDDGSCPADKDTCLLYSGTSAQCPAGYTPVDGGPLYTDATPDLRTCSCGCQYTEACDTEFFGSIAANCGDQDWFGPLTSSCLSAEATGGTSGFLYTLSGPHSSAPSCSSFARTTGKAPVPTGPHLLCCKG
jgi:hypothetical protein